MSASPYRQFCPHAVHDARVRGGAGHCVMAARAGATPLLLTELEYRVAIMMDGRSPPEALLAQARELCGASLAANELEAFAADLAIAGLLEPGSLEPLPVPGVAERVSAGATAGQYAAPPSTMPGSLAGPGLFEGLLRLVTDARGHKRKPFLRLSPRPWIALGAVFNAPLAGTLSFWLFAALMVATGFGFWHRRFEALADLVRLHTRAETLFSVALAILLIHVCTQAARAAAIARFTGSIPQMGLRRGLLWLPVVDVDSGGAPQRAARPARTRIVAAGLTSMAMLFLLTGLMWLMFRRGATTLAPYSLAVALLALLTLVLRLNPVARRDGHFLLAQFLGIPDLREQVLARLYGSRRGGWISHQRPLSPSVTWLYLLLSFATLLLLMVLLSVQVRWLSITFGGTGFFLFLVYLGVIVSQTFRGSRSGGANLNLGQSQLQLQPWWQLSRTTWIALAVLVVLSFVPYHFHPAGDFVVLPSNRADVRALTAGDVREVLVKEGDVVKAGQTIARISNDEEVARIAGSEARLAQLQADLSLAKKGSKVEEVDVARSALETASKRAEVSAAQAQRLAEAFKRKSVTAQDYERARGIADVDRKAVEETQSRLELVKSPVMEDRLAALEAQVQQAQAELNYNRKQLSYTQITAPIAGRVVSGTLMFARGNFLNRGDRLAVIEALGDRLAEVKLPETAIGEIKLGGSTRTKAWAFPGSSFSGVVREIAPSAEDSLAGRVVRVQVSITDPENRLLPGMTGNAKVTGDWHLAIVVFSRALVRFLFVEVWSWIP